MSRRRFELVLAFGALGSAGWLAGCGDSAKISKVSDGASGGLDWKENPSFEASLATVTPYTGSDEIVLEAQSDFPTAADFHRKVILRSCGPLEGVCHNQKEYPDLRTPFNFLSTIDAPCNVQSGTLEGVYDRCERIGDRFALGDGPEREIGWLEVIPSESEEEPAVKEDMPGLHIHLADPITEKVEGEQLSARFIRTFVQANAVEDLSYARLDTRWHLFDEGRHIVGVIGGGDAADEVNALLAVGIEQGDLNRNGTFGARPDENGVSRGPVSLIERGDPETSYIVSRLRGHMQGEPVPGSRMPLANPPFSVPEMLAFFCFIEGLPETGDVNLDSPIDYSGCKYIDPKEQLGLAVEGTGTGWKERILPLLEANCGGCHSKERAEGELVLVGSDVYDTLVSKPATGDKDGRPYIDPGKPASSYLYLKLTGDPSITGKAMPLDPLAGVRKLSTPELNDIAAWIEGGALP